MRIESEVWYQLSHQDKERLLKTHKRVFVVYEGFSQEVTLGGSEKFHPKCAADGSEQIAS